MLGLSWNFNHCSLALFQELITHGNFFITLVKSYRYHIECKLIIFNIKEGGRELAISMRLMVSVCIIIHLTCHLLFQCLVRCYDWARRRRTRTTVSTWTTVRVSATCSTCCSHTSTSLYRCYSLSSQLCQFSCSSVLPVSILATRINL